VENLQLPAQLEPTTGYLRTYLLDGVIYKKAQLTQFAFEMCVVARNCQKNKYEKSLKILKLE